VVRALRGEYPLPPDAVAYPDSEQQVSALLDWCSEQRLAAIPFGGGSSVVGGVEPRLDGDWRGVARIRAGSFGPALEKELAGHGLSLRHYPQSFEFSTLGGWLATRAGGHFATLHTHIDDLVESMRTVTPRGVLESRRLPASGAGPSPDRLMLGSEGSLGVIVEAWMRVFERPRFRASATLRFDDFAGAAEAVRSLAQSGLHPSNCRLLDANEALINAVGDGRSSYVLVAFESADHPLEAWLERAITIGLDAGAEVTKRKVSDAHANAGEATSAPDAAEQWRRMFLRGPYMRDALVRLGAVVETFETAITWDAFEAFHATVLERTRAALDEVCGGGIVSCRFTHVYPDGVAPYYTVIAPGRGGGQLSQWDAIKAAASEALLEAGGTITHHHAVGRDHAPWYRRQRPALFGDALAAVKRSLDPEGVLNPGVLLAEQSAT
jgi:alkyldihydroxyacetonephosphate synthase